METKDVIFKLRTERGMSQEALAEKVFVTRRQCQDGRTARPFRARITLKLLSGVFDVSVNTLLGSPRQLICQCCGMPLDDTTISHSADGYPDEEYCKWCYSDGEFKYTSPEQLIDFCVEHMSSEQWPAEQVRAHMEAVVPKSRTGKK